MAEGVPKFYQIIGNTDRPNISEAHDKRIRELIDKMLQRVTAARNEAGLPCVETPRRHMSLARSFRANKTKGRRAMRLYYRHGVNSRLGRKWLHVAERCGEVVTFVARLWVQPVEHIKLDFTIMDEGVKFIEPTQEAL